MKPVIGSARNNLPAKSGPVPTSSPIKKGQGAHRGTYPEKPHGRARALSFENATVLTKRGRGQAVDIAIGTGHSEMPLEHVARGLAKIVQKGVRTAVVREWGGFPAVLSADIPAGTIAMRTSGGITAYSLETMQPIAAVPC